MMSGNTNSLKQNKNPGSIFSILSNAKISESSAIAWKLIGGSKVTADLRFRLIRKFRNEIEFIPLPNNKSNLDRVISGNETINIFLPDQAILFQGKIKGYGQSQSPGYKSDTILRLTVPDMIAQIDRRKHLRLAITEELDAKIAFAKALELQRRQVQTFKKDCYDISSGGCSFIVSQAERRFFPIGDMVDDILISLEGTHLKMAGKIVNTIKVEPNDSNNLLYTGHKICVEFQDPAKEVVDLIKVFVFKYLELDEAI